MAVVLVDTSVWVEVHRRRYELAGYIGSDEIAICPAIAQELLQGAQDPDQYASVWDVILGAEMLDSPTPLEIFEDAARIYRQCRDTGYLIASAHDCLIAATAIRNGVSLLHADRDFDHIAEVASLKAVRV